MVWPRLSRAGIDRIAFVARLGDQRLQRAVRLSLGGGPVQAVILAGRAEKALRVFRLTFRAGQCRGRKKWSRLMRPAALTNKTMMPPMIETFFQK